MAMESNDIHTDLHNNLKILQKIIPLTQAFEDVFTEGMCKVPNKKNFDQVLYYLLSIINLEKVKQCVCWPLFDAKDERQFRTAVVNFVNDINKEDNTAHIPRVAPSSLQSPSGDTVAYFLRQISSYCLRTHLNISCDFICSSVLETSDRGYSETEQIIVQEIKNLAKKLVSGNGEKNVLISKVLEKQQELKMVKTWIKEEKVKLKRMLTHAPDDVSWYWTQDIDKNILDWTKCLNNQTEKFASIVLKLKSYNKTVEVLNKLVAVIVGRDHLSGLNVECVDFTFSSHIHKDFDAAVYNHLGKLKLANLVIWVELTCKDLSRVLQENNGIDESIFHTEAAETDITNYLDVLTHMESEIDVNHSLLCASVSSRKRKCKNNTCFFDASCSLGVKPKEIKLISIVDFYKDNKLKFLERLRDSVRTKKSYTFSSEGVHYVENKENITLVDSYQETFKTEYEEKSVTELSANSNSEQSKKISKIPILCRKLETTKLSEQENVNRIPGIKTGYGRMSVVEVVTKTPPSTVTKDYMDLLLDTLYSPSDNLQNAGNFSSDEFSADNKNDSSGILDNTLYSVLEDETFPDSLCDMSAAGNSFISSEFQLSECNNLQKTHPTETSPPSPPQNKRKARASLQALIDKYLTLKSNKKNKDTENKH